MNRNIVGIIKSKLNKKKTIIMAIYSFLMAIAIVLERKIIFTGDVGASYEQNIFLPFEIKDVLKFLIAFILIYIISLGIVILFDNKKFSIISTQKKDHNRKSNFKFWMIFTVITIICWMPFFLTYAPGSVLGDSTASIDQGLDFSKLNNHHPVLYSVFVGIFMRIGRAFNNYNLGVALYSFTQLTIMAGIVGYSMMWLKKKNVSLIYIILSWLYFVATTLFVKYAIIMWKDPLFCSFLFLMTLMLFDIIKSNGEMLKNKLNIIKFIILSILIAFFRNNGFLIVVCIYLTLLIMYRRKTLKFDIIVLTTIILIAIVQGPVYKKLNINSPFEEAVAIPLQQIARTVAYDGEISDEQKEFLNKLYPEEDFKTTYTPMIVDTVKWNKNFSKTFLYDNKVGFFKTWAQMLIPNFGTYVEAYLMETLGFWSTHMQNWYGFADTYIIWEKADIENQYDIHRVDLIQKYLGFSMENKFIEPIPIGSGTLFWIMLFIIAILIANRKSKYIFTFLPGILTWITIMISTPVAFSLRYVFIFAYTLPIMLAIPFIVKAQEEDIIRK